MTPQLEWMQFSNHFHAMHEANLIRVKTNREVISFAFVWGKQTIATNVHQLIRVSPLSSIQTFQHQNVL